MKASPILYPRNGSPAVNERLFRAPSAEYRGTPFWSWNCRLDRAQLRRQIAILQKMGFGGFQMHARTGLATPYLGPDYIAMLRACTRDAHRRKLHAWLYDEDRWPSGYAGGLVTSNPAHRAKYLLLTRTPYSGLIRPTPNVSYAQAGRTESGRMLARYEVKLGPDGCLSHYRRLKQGALARPNSTEWWVYLETVDATPWFNHQGYVDTLSPAALRRFVSVTHEPLKRALGPDFGRAIPGIFTDEPQHIFKEAFPSPRAHQDLVMPATSDFFATFETKYGRDLLDTLPEVVWELPDSRASVSRYRYHEHVAERFVGAFSTTLGRWCQANGLLLTGHMMEEPTLGSQTKAVGEVMRSLAHFHLPGVDMLCDRKELNTLKQAQSVARQYDRPGVMSELYGATGWHFDFVGHKAQGDWQAALGVTLRVPHLAWVSMAGEAKRDYPASISYQSPWWREYPLIEDHFSRVNVVMSRGRPVVRIAVIHPIESYWLACGPLRQTQAQRARLEKRFAELPEWLFGGFFDFDYLSEALLPTQVKPGQLPVLQVGAMAYDVVVVPSLRTIRSTTLAVLRRFVRRGGYVIFAGDPPGLVDAVVSRQALDLAAKSPHCRWDRTELLALLEKWREVDCQAAGGARAPQLLHQLRRDGAQRHLFVCNRNGEKAQLEIFLSVRGKWRVFQRDTLTGSIREVWAEQDAARTTVPLVFPAHGHALFSLRPGRPRVTQASPRPIWKEVAALASPVRVTLSEPNTLLLDQAEWRWNNENWESKDELLRINNLLRLRCGLPRVDGNLPQAWTVQAPDKPLGQITLRFRWNSAVAVDRPQLALEDVGAWTITLNGRIVRAKPTGWWVDESIQTVPLPPLTAASNELLLQRAYTSRTDLEWCYLLGDFGVRMSGRSATLLAPVRTLDCRDWTKQGLPFYTGNVTYHFRFVGQCGEAAVRFPRFAGALLSATLDQGKSRRVAFPPFRAPLGRLAPGQHRMAVTVFGHRANAFGPLHHIDAKLARFGPAAWRSTGRLWTYGYQLRPMGLLAAPKIEIAGR